MIKKNPFALRSIAVAAMLALPAAAMAHDYTYLEGGFVSVDTGNDDDGGYFIGGSVSIAPQLAVIGEWTDIGEVEQIGGGLLYHMPLNRTIDFNAGATIEHISAGNADDTGFGLRGGVRWHAIPAKLELIPEVRYINFEEDGTSVRGTALFRATPQLDLQGFLQAGDDDRFGAGVRYNFGA